MLALISRLLDWFRSLFWKEEMELTLVGLQYSGKTTFVNVIAVSSPLRAAWPASRACHLPEGRAGRSCVCGPRSCSRRVGSRRVNSTLRFGGGGGAVPLTRPGKG